jgi:hypothetical protein
MAGTTKLVTNSVLIVPAIYKRKIYITVAEDMLCVLSWKYSGDVLFFDVPAPTF